MMTIENAMQSLSCTTNYYTIDEVCIIKFVNAVGCVYLGLNIVQSSVPLNFQVYKLSESQYAFNTPLPLYEKETLTSIIIFSAL